MYLLEVRLGDSRVPEEGRSVNVFHWAGAQIGPRVTGTSFWKKLRPRDRR